MIRMRRFAGAVLLAVFAVGALAGCDSYEGSPEQARIQQERLDEYIQTADRWGAEIVAQIPPAEIEEAHRGDAGVRKVVPEYQEWPKTYSWDSWVTMRQTDARTPVQMLDGLEPWLIQQGWMPSPTGETRGKESVQRGYIRGVYVLMVEADTAPPPHAQTLSFRISSPATNKEAR